MTVTLHTLLFITFFTSRMALMAGVKTSFTDVLPKRLSLLNGNLRAFLKHNTLRTVCLHAFLSIPPSTTVVAFFNNISLTCEPLQITPIFGPIRAGLVPLFTVLWKTGFIQMRLQMLTGLVREPYFPHHILAVLAIFINATKMPWRSPVSFAMWTCLLQ